MIGLGSDKKGSFYLSLILVSDAREADVGRVVGLLSHLVAVQRRRRRDALLSLVRFSRTKLGS